MNGMIAMVAERRLLITILFVLLCVVFLPGCGPKRIVGMDGSGEFSSVLAMRVAQTATSQIGTPYRIGGTTPSGFDCSGLVQWAYAQHGINVPRITRDQAKTGQNVSRNNLQPGDIVVFKANSAPNGLHTGIYIGSNQFVHSPNSRGQVKVESLDTPYWASNFRNGRRVVTMQAGR